MSKKKIAIIGGGVGAMTAAYYLTQQPDSAAKYDITIYQLGWRLGGKGASGVNPHKGYRIEEHGLHLWFGFYENSIAWMQKVYQELNRPEEAPLSTFDKAFKPQNSMTFAEHVNGKWVDWKIDFPEKMPGTPGDGKFETPTEEIFGTIFDYLAEKSRDHALGLATGCLGKLIGKKALKKFETTGHLRPFWESVEKLVEKTVTHDLEKHLRKTARLLSHPELRDPKHRDHLVEHLDRTRKWIWDGIGHLVHKSNALRRFWTSLDFAMAMTRGMFKDSVVKYKDGKVVLDFFTINDIDYKAWFIKHGADEHYIGEFPPVKSMYDGPFAFYKGHVAYPNIEAGTALNIFLRLALTSKGHVIWKMQGGMGDTIFGPAYLLLNQLPNVTFKFFHKLRDLKLSEDKKVVESMVMEEQVKLAPGREAYDPLVTANDLPSWPSEPRYEQLDPEQVKALRKNHINLETSWSSWEGEKIPLRRGEDFDELIIGASLASLPEFASELIEANPAWQSMLDKVGTVSTHGLQLWFQVPPKELGVDRNKLLSCYVEPLDTFAEMNHLLKREVWDKDKPHPKTIVYICGAMPDPDDIPPFSDTGYPEQRKEVAFKDLKNYVLNDLQHVLPGAFDADGQFKWDMLFDPENGAGEERLRWQYYRANIDGSERYVFSLVDSSRHRLKTDESGFENVYLTGDWIQNGLNIGFVEGAVISGILTTRAVTGDNRIPIYLPW